MSKYIDIKGIQNSQCARRAYKSVLRTLQGKKLKVMKWNLKFQYKFIIYVYMTYYICIHMCMYIHYICICL